MALLKSQDGLSPQHTLIPVGYCKPEQPLNSRNVPALPQVLGVLQMRIWQMCGTILQLYPRRKRDIYRSAARIGPLG